MLFSGKQVPFLAGETLFVNTSYLKSILGCNGLQTNQKGLSFLVWEMKLQKHYFVSLLGCWQAGKWFHYSRHALEESTTLTHSCLEIYLTVSSGPVILLRVTFEWSIDLQNNWRRVVDDILMNNSYSNSISILLLLERYQ